MSKRKPLLVSFSAGETSAFMSYWIKENLSDDYDPVFVFANTGLENEETLIFADKCDKYFNLNLVWLESVFDKRKGKRGTFKKVDFKTASRKGEPFIDMVDKYGIPNQSYPHCTRETKLLPIQKYAKHIFNTNKYYTAIGIRVDEIDRMNDKFKENRIIYPLIKKDMKPMSKPMINEFWQKMPFRLELKGYQGNCKTCWKKSDKKLWKIAQEDNNSFDIFNDLEDKYGYFIKEGRKEHNQKITFFRRNRSTQDILKESKTAKPIVIDDARVYINQLDMFDDLENESCEVFSNCGDYT